MNEVVDLVHRMHTDCRISKEIDAVYDVPISETAAPESDDEEEVISVSNSESDPCDDDDDWAEMEDNMTADTELPVP